MTPVTQPFFAGGGGGGTHLGGVTAAAWVDGGGLPLHPFCTILSDMGYPFFFAGGGGGGGLTLATCGSGLPFDLSLTDGIGLPLRA